MKARITINMDNAAFDEFPHEELSRILAKLARDIGEYGMNPSLRGMTLHDINGNTVGEIKITGRQAR